jgi:chaperonin cofactor prefoldin
MAQPRNQAPPWNTQAFKQMDQQIKDVRTMLLDIQQVETKIKDSQQTVLDHINCSQQSGIQSISNTLQAAL